MNSCDTKVSIKSAREGALYMAARGFKVFPCLPGDKPPFEFNTEKGKYNCSAKDRKLAGSWNIATSDPARINAWFDHKLDPDFGYESADINYGVAATGMCVVDYDVKKDAWAAVEELIELGTFPDTFTVRTPSNGNHFYFGPADVGQKKLSPNIDVRSRNGYVVGPGCVLAERNNRAYVIVSDAAVAEVPLLVAERLAKAPERAENADEALCELDTEAAVAAGIAHLSFEKGEADGNRGNQGFLLACQLKDIGLSPEKIAELLSEHWNHKNDPPIDEDRLLSMAHNAHKSGRHAAGSSNTELEFGDLPGVLAEIFPGGQSSERQSAASYESLCLADVQPEKVSWLWFDRFALGKINLIAGQPGLGKSQTTCKFIGHVTTGAPWPDGSKCPKGSAIIISCEDDPGDTLRPRLDAVGADTHKVHMLTWVFGKDSSGKTQRQSFDIAAHVPTLRRMALKIGDVKLIVIDPISAYLGAANSHKNAEVRAALVPIQMLAREIGAAVVLVTHLNKNSKETSALNRVTDSGAFVAVARSGWLVASDPEDETGKGRVLIPLKNNIGNDQDGFKFQLETVHLANGIRTSRVVFGDLIGHADPDAILKAPADQKRGKRDDAVDFLQEALKDGPRLSDEVRSQAANLGISERTERRASQLLGIYRSKKAGDPLGRWWIMLTSQIKDFEQAANPA